MFRNRIGLSSRKFLVPVAASAVANNNNNLNNNFFLLPTAAAKTRRPSNLAPTWTTDTNPTDCSTNLKFVAISMRNHEIKSSDLLIRASDKSALLSFTSNAAPAPSSPILCDHDDNAFRNDESNVTRSIISNSETDTTFGDPSGGEVLQFTQPIRLAHRGKGQWGKAFFGKVFHQPRNFAYQTSTYWSKKFRMKKHRYTKRWQKRRYKVAALANLPFAKKLRVNMIPKLNQGKKKSGEAGALDMDFSPQAQDAAAAAATGKLKSGVKKRYRPKSKYQV
jgi:hypothetical protein